MEEEVAERNIEPQYLFVASLSEIDGRPLFKKAYFPEPPRLLDGDFG